MTGQRRNKVGRRLAACLLAMASLGVDAHSIGHGALAASAQAGNGAGLPLRFGPEQGGSPP